MCRTCHGSRFLQNDIGIAMGNLFCNACEFIIRQHRISVYAVLILVCFFSVTWGSGFGLLLFAIFMPWFIIGGLCVLIFPRVKLLQLEGANIPDESGFWAALFSLWMFVIIFRVYERAFDGLSISYGLSLLPEYCDKLVLLVFFSACFASLFRKNIMLDCFWLEYNRANTVEKRNAVARSYSRYEFIDK